MMSFDQLADLLHRFVKAYILVEVQPRRAFLIIRVFHFGAGLFFLWSGVRFVSALAEAALETVIFLQRRLFQSLLFKESHSLVDRSRSRRSLIILLRNRYFKFITRTVLVHGKADSLGLSLFT